MAHAMFKNCFVHFSVFSTAYVYIFRVKLLWWQRQLVQAGYELRKVIKYRANDAENNIHIITMRIS